MKTTRNSSRSFISILAHNRLGLVISIVLLTALVAGSSYLLLNSQDELSRIERDARALGTLTVETARLGQVSSISSKDWMAGSITKDRVPAILATLNKGKCCTLDSDFAIGSLNFLGQAANGLTSEKQQIRAIELSSEAALGIQADVLAVYKSHESLVRLVTELIVDWNTYFNEARDARLKAAEDALRAEISAYDGIKTRLEQHIADARQKENDYTARQQDVDASQSAWQQRSALAIGGIVLAVVLFAVLIALVARARVSSAAGLPRATSDKPVTQSQRQRKK